VRRLIAAANQETRKFSGKRRLQRGRAERVHPPPPGCRLAVKAPMYAILCAGGCFGNSGPSAWTSAGAACYQPVRLRARPDEGILYGGYGGARLGGVGRREKDRACGPPEPRVLSPQRHPDIARGWPEQDGNARGKPLSAAEVRLYRIRGPGTG